MTAFRWRGTDALGLPQHGALEAKSLEEAHLQLAGLGLSDILIRQRSRTRNSEDTNRTQVNAKRNAGPKIRASKKQLGILSRYLANLLSAGIPIIDALDLLEEGGKNENAKLLRSLKNSLNDGLKLGDAMAQHPAVFDPYFVSLVRCEEIAGQLHRALTHLANHLEQTESLHRKVRQSLLQPSLILLTAVLVTWLLLTFVMPEFAKMYTQQDQQLPHITRWVIDLSAYLQLYGSTGLILLGACSVAAFVLVKSVASLGLIFDRLLLRLPFVGHIIQQTNIVDFSRTLAAMLTAGVALNESLVHAGASCRNAAFRQALAQTTAGVENGAALHQAMSSSACFPVPFRRMARLGEEAGKLDQMLEHASVIYREDIQRTVDNLVPLIEPILMLILGVVVGGLILAMYLPIFSMGTLLHT